MIAPIDVAEPVAAETSTDIGLVLPSVCKIPLVHLALAILTASHRAD